MVTSSDTHQGSPSWPQYQIDYSNKCTQNIDHYNWCMCIELTLLWLKISEALGDDQCFWLNTDYHIASSLLETLVQYNQVITAGTVLL